MGNAAGELDHFQAALDIAVAVGHRLAVLGRQQFGQRLLFPLDEIKKPEKHAGTLLRVLRRPIGLRGGGTGDRRLRLGLRGQGDLRLDLAQCRVPDIGGPAALARYRLATDKMTDIRCAIARHFPPLETLVWFANWIIPGAARVQTSFGAACRTLESPARSGFIVSKKQIQLRR